MQDRSRTLANEEALPSAEERSAAMRSSSWSVEMQEEILSDHPELENDNKGFIQELLRRHAACVPFRQGISAKRK
jgi:hypothetical protein